jgi:two-component system sensor histidine kinase KdpD
VTRPDPDPLLAHVEAEETCARRLRLRIFFGSSEGVGTSYGMHDAAQTKRRRLVGAGSSRGAAERRA